MCIRDRSLLPWLVLRSDPALTFFTIVAVLGLISLAGGFTIKGSAFDTQVRRLVANVVAPSLEWAFGIGMASRFVRRVGQEHSMGGVLRGAVIAAPILVIFTALLASADDVFAQFLLLNDLPQVLGHLALTALFSVLLFGYVSRAAHETEGGELGSGLRVLGRVEVAMVLGGLTLLFAGFTVTQLVVAFGGADTVFETEGLTQADHARSGFFQLVWVALSASVLVGGLRAIRKVDDSHGEPLGGRDPFTPLAVATLGLTIVIGAISSQRFVSYIDTFGLTLDRFWAVAIVGTIMALIVLYIVSLLGWRADIGWFPMTAVLGVAVLMFGLNLINPSARVAEFNMTTDSEVELDVYHLSQLPDDAMPTVLANLDRIAPEDATQLVERLCERSDRTTTYGVFEANRSSILADDQLDDLCGQSRIVVESTFFD